MAVVVDASLLVALGVNDARAPAVDVLFQAWLAAGEEIHAPMLAPYEVANAVTRLVVARAFPVAQVSEAWQTLSALPIIYHSLQARVTRLSPSRYASDARTPTMRRTSIWPRS